MTWAALVAAATWLIAAGPQGPPRRLRLPSGPAGSGAPHPALAAPPWFTQAWPLTGMGADPDRAWQGLGVACVVAAAASYLLLGAGVAGLVIAGVGVTAHAAPGPVVRWTERRRDDQLPAALERMAAALRSGQSPVSAFGAMCDSSPEPLAGSLANVEAEVRHGLGLREAVERWSDRPDATAAVRMAGAAISIGAQSGGAIARALDQTAGALRQQQQLRAEARALAAQARASAGLLATAPVGFGAVVSMVEPGLLRFLTTNRTGLACLVGGLALEVAGLRWMSRIVGGVR